MKANSLLYVGKIVDLTSIENADFIHCVTVVCGEGGKWYGIVRKSDFELNDLCYDIGFSLTKTISQGASFDKTNIETLGESKYYNEMLKMKLQYHSG